MILMVNYLLFVQKDSEAISLQAKGSSEIWFLWIKLEPLVDNPIKHI